MYVEQLYTNCLAEAAYYIESEGEAIVIDPIRETDPYINLAQKRGAKIKYIFETHFHADFVSGHLDLAAKTGAMIVYGPGANPEYEIYVAKNNEEFKIGKVKLKVLHTPGHTMESSCFLLIDENGKDYALFSGDTLFVGDVGRPDLAVKSDEGVTAETLAGFLFESLNSKIKPLADDVLLYPAHGPGSACGKNLGSETWSTIGEQKQNNYALKIQDKKEFVHELLDGLLPPPAYFFQDATINRTGYENLESVLEKNVRALTVADVENEIANGSLVLDTRDANTFEKGFIPGSINIGLNGSYAVWIGALIDIHTSIVVIAEVGKEKEAILRLARVGYEKISGYLEGSFTTWKNTGKSFDTMNAVDASALMETISNPDLTLIDVRKVNEHNSGHVEGSYNLPLDDINKKWDSLDKDKNYVIHCAGGYRSMIFCSILRQKGFKNITNVRGGMAKMKEANVPLVVPETV